MRRSEPRRLDRYKSRSGSDSVDARTSSHWSGRGPLKLMIPRSPVVKRPAHHRAFSRCYNPPATDARGADVGAGGFMAHLHMPEQKQPEADLTRVYDAIVVGSGAAGGMAAHALTARGLQVLLLEAGKKLDIESELKSMEWPYDHPRRGLMPPDRHAISFNEYTIRQPPYAKDSPYAKVHSYVQGWGGSDYSKNIVVDEKEHPYTGTGYAWVRARCLGGKTNIWGRLALRLSDYDFKAKSHDGYGEDWPISYPDLAPYYDKVDLYLGISGVKENLPHLPDSLFHRAIRLNWGEVKLRESLKKSGQVLTPYRAGVTTDGLKHNRYRSKCYGRGACDRRPGGCDIHAVFDSPTGLIY